MSPNDPLPIFRPRRYLFATRNSIPVKSDGKHISTTFNQYMHCPTFTVRTGRGGRRSNIHLVDFIVMAALNSFRHYKLPAQLLFECFELDLQECTIRATVNEPRKHYIHSIAIIHCSTPNT